MGRIGRAIARRAQGFDLRISYTDIRAFDDLDYRYEPELEALARDSDFLIVAAAGGPQSRGLVGASVLNALGPEGILVNVARGSVVDEQALVSYGFRLITSVGRVWATSGSLCRCAGLGCRVRCSAGR